MLPVRIIVIFHIVTFIVNAQLSDICENSGKVGICVLLEHCPAAIKLVKERKHPKLCGFDKNDPIVCCEIVTDVVNKFGEPGDIARQICIVYFDVCISECSEYLTDTKPRTTTTTTTSPRPLGSPLLVAPFVVDGYDAYPLEFPHMALLGYGSEENIQWKCGGSLISEKFVLTAAHCINSGIGIVAFIKLGVHQITTYSIHDRQFRVKNVYQHPDYDSLQKYNDIALLEFDGELVFLPTGIKPACLQLDKQIPDIFIATGWGATEYGNDVHDTLQKVNLTLIPIETCQRTYRPGRELEKGLLDDSQICAGSVQGRGDTCQGDSGGPIQVEIEGSKMYTLLGITSFGKNCGIVPAVYTRVSYYVSWIESIAWPPEA
ncbi:eg:bacr7a4.3 protein-related [Holotrichia oblita]|uniref:Eg:bacr7a4.3 protein-related n=1 Tax=Holotrichia oblita TaxID=644536 RepID=A0ACB9SZQ0_HOLOL|nr:eg:bacr7a4.3 protein-related [Holotrichia oblita]